MVLCVNTSLGMGKGKIGKLVMASTNTADAGTTG
jgi:hypothetical protein